MNVDLSRPLFEVFAQIAEAKAEEKRNARENLLQEEFNRQDREQRVAKEEREKKEREERSFDRMLASTERLAAFSARLDELETASVKALMKNTEALDRVQAQLDAMLERAEKLPDGRRIFKTQDGTRVFDEHGAELSPAVVDPHAVSDVAPRWEPFKALQDKKAGIVAERREILDYQGKLDQARARLDKGGVTNKDLDALDADLKATMPQAVRNAIKIGDPAQETAVKAEQPASTMAAHLARSSGPAPNPVP